MPKSTSSSPPANTDAALAAPATPAWFIPPYVIPAVIIVAVVITACFRAYA
jgi:hypothetical protein